MKISVPIVPASKSKIIWAQAASIISMLLVLMFGDKAGLSPEAQTVLATILGIGFDVVTGVLRTWFTTSVTPASAAKL